MAKRKRKGRATTATATQQHADGSRAYCPICDEDRPCLRERSGMPHAWDWYPWDWHPLGPHLADAPLQIDSIAKRVRRAQSVLDVWIAESVTGKKATPQPDEEKPKTKKPPKPSITRDVEEWQKAKQILNGVHAAILSNNPWGAIQQVLEFFAAATNPHVMREVPLRRQRREGVDKANKLKAAKKAPQIADRLERFDKLVQEKRAARLDRREARAAARRALAKEENMDPETLQRWLLRHGKGRDTSR